MADDFERAVIIAFNVSGTTDASLKERAESFLAEIKRSPEVWKLCVERFSITGYSEVKFWCLQTLQEIIRSSYGSLHVTARDMIKNALLTWVTRDCCNTQVTLPAFLRNKVSQTLVAVLQHEYPGVWPGFFQDLLRAVLPGSQLAAAGVAGQASGTLAQIVPGGEPMVDMFCRILVSVDEDLVSLDIPRSQDESKLSMHVKDSMREHSVADIAASWQLLATAYAGKSPDLAAMVLNTMQRYISWIDIGLVANDKFVAQLQAFLDNPNNPNSLRGAAADCLTEIVTKRMDAVPKLGLIQSMGIVPRCAAWASALPRSASQEDIDEEFVGKVAKLLAAIAEEVMEAMKRVENGVISLTAMGLGVSEEAAQEARTAAQRATQLLEQLLPVLLAAFRSEVNDVSLPLLPFFSAYVARLKTLQKRNANLDPATVAHVHAIFEGVASCGRYPRESAYDMDCGPAGPMSPSATANGRMAPPGKLVISAAAKDEQAEVEEKRRDLFTLYRNLAKTAYNEALAFLGRMLQSIIAAAGPTAAEPAWQDVEIALTLLYEIGESGIDDMTKPDCGALAPLVSALAHACSAAGGAGMNGNHAGGNAAPTPQSLGIRALPCSTHPLVALVVLESLIRYSKVFQQAPVLLPGVLQTLFDRRGMDHPCEEVSTRACYLFCRIAKQLRGTLRPFLASILPTIQPILGKVAMTPLVDSPQVQTARDTASKASAPVNAVVDDRLYVFEAVGLLLGQEELSPDEQAAALAALLQPLTNQIQANLRSAPGGPVSGTSAPGMIIQSLEAVVRINKGFKTDLVTRSRPALGNMFAGVFEVALSVAREYPEHRMLRARFISCVHRLVEGLQGLVLPLLPNALEALVSYPQSEAPDLTDVLVLANQLACRFKEGLAPLMEGLLPIIVSRMHAVLGSSWDWSGRQAAPSPVLLAPSSGAATSNSGAAGAGGGTQPSSPLANGHVASGGTTAVTTLRQGAVTATLEENREKGELQKAYYSLLHGIAHNGLSGVLLKRDPSLVLEPVMTALTRGAAAHVDPAVRRTCVQIYCRLITEWCSSGSAEAIPGFRRYAMEHLGGEACVLGVLRSQPPLDPRDGSTLALLQDLANALKLVNDRCGEDFSRHLVTVVAPAAGLPAHLAEQLAAQVRMAEAKDVRDCLRALLVQISGNAGK